jgi:hypothetical protein
LLLSLDFDTLIIAQGHLLIEDAFTIQAGLLALPRLRKEFGLG